MKAEGKATAKEPKNVVLQSWVYVFIYLIFLYSTNRLHKAFLKHKASVIRITALSSGNLEGKLRD